MIARTQRGSKGWQVTRMRLPNADPLGSAGARKLLRFARSDKELVCASVAE
jgi:hypothetical protein